MGQVHSNVVYEVVADMGLKAPTGVTLSRWLRVLGSEIRHEIFVEAADRREWQDGE